MQQVFYILFGAGFCALVSIAAGKLLLRVLKLDLYKEEETPLALVIGGACLSMIVFAMAASHLVYKKAFLAVGFAIVMAALWKRVFTPQSKTFQPLPRTLIWIYGIAGAIFFVLTFLHAMAPEWSADGSAYHLGLVSRYFREHGFPRITTNMYANLSQGVEMLFLFAFSFGAQHSSAALTHFTYLVALVGMMVSYARRFGFANAGMGAALIVFVSPVVGIDAASAYNDVAVAAILFAVFYMVQIWDQTRQNAWFIPIGLAAGFAFGSKYTAFLAVPYALGFLVWKLGSKSLKPLLIVSATAAIMITPWLIKNVIIVSNPLSPFFNTWFPNPYINIGFEQEYKHHMTHYAGLNNYWEIPLGVTVKGQVLGGIIGPLFLLLPLGLFALRSQHGRRLWCAGLLFGAIYSTNVGTRFLIPALPFASLVLALTFDKMKGLLPAIAMLHALISWPDMIVKYSDQWVWRLEEVAWRPALRLESEDAFLSRRWPPYGVARMIEKATPPDAKILSFNQTAEAYMSRNYLVVYQSSEGAALGAIMQMPLVAVQVRTHIAEFTFPKIEATGIRLRQTAKAKIGEMWVMHDLRIRNASAELRPNTNWRTQTSPRPWDVNDLFDGNPATRWRSWETMQPGMFAQATFGSTHSIDSVAVETGKDGTSAEFALDIQRPDGTWSTVNTKPSWKEVPPPPDARFTATRALKARGVTHIMLQINEFGGEDYESKQQEWGIQKVAESFGARLYKIE